MYQSKFDLTRLNQFGAGSANVFITRFAERSENSEGRLTSDIDTTTDRSEDPKSNTESLIKQRDRISLTVLPVKVSLDEVSQFSMFSKPHWSGTGMQDT